MFKLGGFCEDKNVPKVLRALQGLMIGQPDLVPVIGAEVKGGKIVATNGSGSMLDLFHGWTLEHDKGEFTVQDAKRFCVEIGKPESAYGNLLTRGKSLGLIRAKGKGKNAVYSWAAPKKGKGK